MQLDKLPALLAVGTFIAISLVVSHEWAYFGVIGPELQSLFTTYDYLAQMIVWIGPAFIFLMIAGGLQIMILRSDNFEFKKVAKSRWGRVIEEWHSEMLFFVSGVAALLFSSEARRLPLFVLIGLLWLRGAAYVLGFEGFKDFRRSAVGLLFLTVPSAMIVSYGVGRDDAYADLRSNHGSYELRLKGKYITQEIQLLRLVERGVILLDIKANSVEFVRREDVELLKRSVLQWEQLSFACRHWGICGLLKRDESATVAKK